jgi:hypothetical protein
VLRFRNARPVRSTCTANVEYLFLLLVPHPIVSAGRRMPKDGMESHARGECSDVNLPGLTVQGTGQLVVAELRAFGRKHIDAIKSLAMDGLDVDHDPEMGLRDALVIYLKLFPEPTLVESMFQAIDARIYALSDLGNRELAQGMADHLKAGFRMSGGVDSRFARGIHVLLYNTDSRRVDAFPVFFSAAEIHLLSNFGPEYSALEWNEALLALLNKGVATKGEVRTIPRGPINMMFM